MIKTNIRPLNTHTLSGNVSTQTSRHISTGTVSGDSGQNEITSNIQQTDTHSLDGNITTQSQHQITSGGLDTNIENDPIFRHSPAYEITQQDIDNWNAAYNVDMDEYVSKVELVEQSYVTSETLDAAAYVTHEFLSAQAYLTSVEFPDYSNTYQAKGDYVTPTDLDNAAYITNETDPIFSASPAAGITEQDITNWNNGAGIDLSSYVTYEFLSAQSYITPAQLYSMSYITINDVVFPDYSNTYQAKGDYITPSMLGMAAYVSISQLVAQSYLTSETDPVFSASPAGSITSTDIANWNAAAGGIDMSSYVTKSELVSQSYITINDVVFPDYSNTYQAKGNYVTQEVLTQQAYLTSESDPIFSASPAAGITAQDIQNWNAGAGIDLSSYVTYEYLSAQSYVSATYQNNAYNINFNKPLKVKINTEGVFGNYVNIIGDEYSSFSIYSGLNNLDPNYHSGVFASVSYNTNTGTYGGFAMLQQYSSGGGTTSVRLQKNVIELLSNYITLGKANVGASNPYILTNSNGTMHIGTSLLSISNTVHLPYKYSSWPGDYTPAASYGFVWDNLNTYVFSQSYITPNVLASQSYLTSETDPVFSASPAAGITAQDITNWNNGAGIDLSSYVTYEYLSAQSYLTSVTFPDYSNTYQAKGDYITPTILNNQSYVTSTTLTSCGYTTVRLVTEAQYQDQQDDILYVITDADPIDVSDCVRQSELVAQAYVTAAQLVAQSYITSVTFPDYSNTYQAKGDYITPTVLNNQSYVTAAQLYAQSYVTQNSIVFPNYSNTYQAKGDYITPTILNNQSYVTAAQLVAQSYITSVTFPDYSNTYQAKGDYITPTILNNQSYVTAAQLYAQAYVTQNSIVFPDYSNTYQAKGDYITPTILNNQSYVTSTTLTNCGYTTVRLVTEAQYQDQQDDILYVITDADPIDVSDCVRQSELVAQAYVTQTTLTAQSYVTPTTLVAQSYVTTTTLSNQSYVTPTTLVAQSYTTSTYVFDNYTSYSYINDRIDTDLVTKAELTAILANYMLKPDIIYETDGTTGLLGENANTMNLTNWQLENVDFSGYKYVLAFIKQADLPISGTNNQYITPALVVYIPLDAASRSTQYDAYVGSTGGTNMNDPDVHFIVQCAIDSTKTKFKVVNEGSVAGTIWGDRNNRGRYCYKIEGYK